MSRDSLPSLADDFSRALLGSAEADEPSNAAYAKVAAGLGLGVGLGVGASLPAPTAVATGVAGMARWSSSLVGAKLWVLGVSGVLLGGSGALLLGSSRSTPPVIQSGPAQAAPVIPEPARAAPASPPSERARSASPPVSPVLSPANAGSLAAGSAPRVPASSAGHPHAPPLLARRTAHSASAARASTGSSLAEQVQSLDRARVALGSGNSSSALREIALYRAAWPDGVFLTEASVLEIEALAVRGERSLARTRAAEFVAAHPDSPQADRLRALIPTQNR